MRRAFTGLWLLIILGCICKIFWHQEWKYNLPTPVPQNYREVKTGSVIDLQGKVSLEPGKPALIHFFNPNCPCSRFNITHFNSLVRKYQNQFSFAVVVICPNNSYTADEIRNRFDLTVPVLIDTTIAGICGVYSTPQAVILDASRRMYYRGNYNKSRYCTDRNSNYAQMAMDSLLLHNLNPVFGKAAITAYGCQVASYCTIDQNTNK